MLTWKDIKVNIGGREYESVDAIEWAEDEIDARYAGHYWNPNVRLELADLTRVLTAEELVAAAAAATLPEVEIKRLKERIDAALEADFAHVYVNGVRSPGLASVPYGGGGGLPGGGGYPRYGSGLPGGYSGIGSGGSARSPSAGVAYVSPSYVPPGQPTPASHLRPPTRRQIEVEKAERGTPGWHVHQADPTCEVYDLGRGEVEITCAHDRVEAMRYACAEYLPIAVTYTIIARPAAYPPCVQCDIADGTVLRPHGRMCKYCAGVL